MKDYYLAVAQSVNPEAVSLSPTTGKNCRFAELLSVRICMGFHHRPFISPHQCADALLYVYVHCIKYTHFHNFFFFVKIKMEKKCVQLLIKQHGLLMWNEKLNIFKIIFIKVWTRNKFVFFFSESISSLCFVFFLKHHQKYEIVYYKTRTGEVFH